jgi:hypothetical protein
VRHVKQMLCSPSCKFVSCHEQAGSRSLWSKVVWVSPVLQVLLLGPKMIQACKRVDIQAIMRLMDAGADVTLPDLEPEV